MTGCLTRSLRLLSSDRHLPMGCPRLVSIQWYLLTSRGDGVMDHNLTGQEPEVA